MENSKSTLRSLTERQIFALVSGGALLAGAVLALSGCGSEPTEPTETDPVAIQVGEREVRLSELQAQVDFSLENGGLRGVDKARFIELYTERLVALENAYAAGVDQDIELQRQWENLLIGRFKKNQLNTALAAVSVTDEEVAAYYQANLDQYSKPAQVRLALLYLEKHGDDVVAFRARMEEGGRLAAELPAGTRGFGALAMNYSEHATSRFKGGDIGWLQAGQSQYSLPKEIIEQGFALDEKGALSPVIETDEGFYLLMQLDAREPVVRPLEGRLTASLQNILLKQKRAEIEAELESEWAASAVPVLQAEVIDQIKFTLPEESTAASNAVTRTP